MLTVDANVWVAAADPSDAFYATSRQLLIAIARKQLPIYLPAFARIEIACALARRRRDAAVGQMLADALLTSVHVVHVAQDSQFLAHTLLSGTKAFLRGADALYVATSQLYNTRLISWDQELAQRAAALTPNEWLIRNP